MGRERKHEQSHPAEDATVSAADIPPSEETETDPEKKKADVPFSCGKRPRRKG